MIRGISSAHKSRHLRHRLSLLEMDNRYEDQLNSPVLPDVTMVRKITTKRCATLSSKREHHLGNRSADSSWRLFAVTKFRKPFTTWDLPSTESPVGEVKDGLPVGGQQVVSAIPKVQSV